MLYIDRYAYTNKLTQTHPGEKFAFTAITLIICLASGSPVVSISVAILMAGAVIIGAGIPWLFYVKLLTIPISFLLVGVVTVAFTISPNPLEILVGFTIGRFTIGVTGKSLAVAGGLFFKSLGGVSCLYFLSLTTPMVDIFWVLKKMRAPSLFVELMNLIYRFIFVLMETAEKIFTSQTSRLGYKSLKISYNSLGGLASNLFIKSYHRSQALFTTLSSRCYNGDLNVIEQQYSLSRKNIVLILVAEISLIILMLCFGGDSHWWNI